MIRSSFIRVATLLLLLPAVFLISLEAQESKLPREEANPYFKIYDMYWRWQNGFVGSKSHFRGKLKRYLWTLHGKKFTSDNCFILKSPEAVYSKEIICTIYQSRWLEIYGKLDEASIVNYAKGDKKILKKWWRSGKLFSVQGQIRYARISKGPLGDTVLIFLKVIKIIPANDKKTGINNNRIKKLDKK